MTPLVSTSRPRIRRPHSDRPTVRGDVLVACPDARPPAYEAAAGLAASGHLGRFVTSYYRTSSRRWTSPPGLGLVPRVDRQLARRRHAGIPDSSVEPTVLFDLCLAVELRVGPARGDLRRKLARWRTDHFDRLLARRVERSRPSVAFFFSDVASAHAGPACRRLGVPRVVSMVTGDPREEQRILAEEAERSPDVFRLYLGDSPIDADEMAWLHERRQRDLEWADLILVPSPHIANELERHGTPRERIRVIPYAADTDRFSPVSRPSDPENCSFLFAGGISQRKGIKYLLQAWQSVRRPGWRLMLLGQAPRDLSPLSRWLDGVELVGRVLHADVPGVMASADVFVFPSLFEGSAVVTYEALACGLPSIVTPAAGSVVRDGHEGLLVPSADVETLAAAMEQLGLDPELRREMGQSARLRAQDHGWRRYHQSVVDACSELQSR